LIIFYQSIKVLRTKCSAFTNNIYVSSHRIYCLTQTWLNYAIFSYNLLRSHFIFRDDRDNLNLNITHGGGVLIAVSELLQGVKRRHSLETTNESVWIEISVNGSLSLLTVNRYFPSDCNIPIIEN
jgi:hypothetical protein